MVLELLAFDKQ